jgi:hypothetical protein
VAVLGELPLQWFLKMALALALILMSYRGTKFLITEFGVKAPVPDNTGSRQKARAFMAGQIFAHYHYAARRLQEKRRKEKTASSQAQSTQYEEALRRLNGDLDSLGINLLNLLRQHLQFLGDIERPLSLETMMLSVESKQEDLAPFFKMGYMFYFLSCPKMTDQEYPYDKPLRNLETLEAEVFFKQTDPGSNNPVFPRGYTKEFVEVAERANMPQTLADILRSKKIIDVYDMIKKLSEVIGDNVDIIEYYE